MTTTAGQSRQSRSKSTLRTVVGPVVVLALIAAMAFDTTVVTIGSDRDVQEGVFSAEAYGAEEFPRIQSIIEGQATPAETLATSIEEDRDAAVEQYGVPAGVGPVFSVTFAGEVGEGKLGVYEVAVPGLPDDILVRVQTGPAINGTDLRDATGTIEFGQFTNQIEYQDAGSALNNEMKAEVLADLDRDNLTGRTIAVTGVFRLVNPESWLVTPVRLSVQ